jgi:hypothetical protein
MELTVQILLLAISVGGAVVSALTLDDRYRFGVVVFFAVLFLVTVIFMIISYFKDAHAPSVGVVGGGSINGTTITITGNYNPVTVGNSSAANPLIDAQFTDISSLERFVGGKDEYELHELFDFPNMILLNIQLTKARLQRASETKTNVFDMTAYLGNGEKIHLNTEIAGDTLQMSPTGRATLNPDPHRMAMIILTKKYLESKRALFVFEDSVKLPTAIIESIKKFDRAVEENTSNIHSILDSDLPESPEYFLSYDDDKSKYFGAANESVMKRFIQLKPKADDIISAIRSYLKVN